MKNRLYRSLKNSSDIRALLVLLVVYALRARRIIPTLRPHQVLMPFTILQITLFILAALITRHFISVIAIGNLIIVSIAMIPTTFERPMPAPAAHWIK